MPIHVKLTDTGEVVEIQGASSMQELLASDSQTLASIAKGVDYFITALGYAELMHDDSVDQKVLSDLVKAHIGGDFLSDTPDLHGIEERLEVLVNSDIFKAKYSQLVSAVLTNFLATFASGVSSAYNDEAGVINSGICETDSALRA